MAFFTYMVIFENGYLYTGSTGNITRRGREHRRYGEKPKVIWKERFGTREEAFAREKQIQGWSRAKKLALADGKKDELVTLSKRRAGQPLQKRVGANI